MSEHLKRQELFTVSEISLKCATMIHWAHSIDLITVDVRLILDQHSLNESAFADYCAQAIQLNKPLDETADLICHDLYDLVVPKAALVIVTQKGEHRRQSHACQLQPGYKLPQLLKPYFNE